MNIFETEALLKESGVWSVNYLHVETEQLIVDLKVFEGVWSRLKAVEGLGKNDVDCWGFWKTIRRYNLISSGTERNRCTNRRDDCINTLNTFLC